MQQRTDEQVRSSSQKNSSWPHGSAIVIVRVMIVLETSPGYTKSCTMYLSSMVVPTSAISSMAAQMSGSPGFPLAELPNSNPLQPVSCVRQLSGGQTRTCNDERHEHVATRIFHLAFNPPEKKCETHL